MVDAIAIAAYVGVLIVVDRAGAAGRLFSLGLPLLAMAAASIVALIAIVRRHERALLVWIALIPGALVLLALIAEATGLME